MGIEQQVIPNEFRSRLDALPDDKTIGVIISGLTAEGISDLPTAEKRARAAEHYRNAIKPIVEYLEEHGIPVGNRMEMLGMVYANLNRPQIYDLAEQPYVRAIMENQEIHLIQ